ncbi:MAG: MGMT family protein, partial [Patescibacteria group bacterium]
DIAYAVGRPRAWRYVGTVLSKNGNRNTPCHRVVRSDGTVGGFGFSGGSTEKIRRLRRDGVQIKNDRVNLRKYRIRSPKTLSAGY